MSLRAQAKQSRKSFSKGGLMLAEVTIENTIERSDNIIRVNGKFNNLSGLLANMHHAIERGYSEIILDFSKCTVAFAPNMLSICSQAMARRNADVYVKLELPDNEKLRRLFLNANWANLIDPRRYETGKKNLYTTHIPATQYKNPLEQNKTVNKIVNVILGMIPEMVRSDFEAFEWSINEITDNVLTHSQSIVGGLVQLSVFEKQKKVQYIVADAGVGIPNSMRSGAYPELNDVDSLDKAVREGVTRDKSLGQGNGLFGSYQISYHCQGSFSIRSGNGYLSYTDQSGFHVSNDKVPYDGTLVVAEVDFSRPGLLADALKFGGTNYSPPFNYIESKYEDENDSILLFKLKSEAESFGTRPAGTPVRNKLFNLYKMNTHQKIKIDFDGVPLMSSSFADEVFGKLFVEVGPMEFTQKFEFVNIIDTAKGLINKAITQRMKTS